MTVPTYQSPTVLPEGSKLLQLLPCAVPSNFLQGGVVISGPVITEDDLKTLDAGMPKDPQCLEAAAGPTQTQIWGIPWTEEAFLKQMVKFGHPAMLDMSLPAILKDAVERYRTMTAAERVTYRTQRLSFWVKRLKDLKHEERAFKQTLDQDVAIVLKDKNLLLWKHMLSSAHFPDQDVFSEFTQGTTLVGEVQRTGLWPSKFQPATITEDELFNVARMERPAIGRFARPGMLSERLEDVWRTTLEESEAGMLVGPIALDQVPCSYPLSRRFGVLQNNKVRLRCVDDFSMSSVNRCVQCHESPKPHTIDVFAALCVQVMSSVQIPKTESWVGRGFDLKGAYRQCAVRPTSHKFLYIFAVEPRTSEIFAFRMRALPFGAIKSVHGFLRTALSLWRILVSEFLVLTTSYFDDFVTIGTDSEASNLTGCVQLFFKLVGWRFAATGPKAPDFAEIFSALGVSVNVSGLGEGSVLLDNTENRKLELLSTIDKVVASGTLPKRDALKLRGRLQFASGQVFGRIARAALSAVTAHAYSSGGESVGVEAMFALKLHRKLLAANKPRILRLVFLETWFILTDACFEPRGESFFSGIGAVLCSPVGTPVKFFSEEIDETTLTRLNPESKKTVILECEFFALFCALESWMSDIGNSVVVYTDNNAVRDILISCHSQNLTAMKMLVATLVLEAENNLCPWYARVPTDSNISDSPSRLDCALLESFKAERIRLNVSSLRERVSALFAKWGD